tara:strand:- start:366 stop:587 length:222 start_codon:yes stop_codon:yes gene_type:complete
MAKDEKKTITVNDITRNVEDLNEQEVVMVNHIHDLDRKLANARFNVDQLTVGRDAFVNMLTSAFGNPVEQPTE